MNKQQLEEKKKKIEDDFAALEDKKQQTTKLLNDINLEQVKLQGEFRLVDELIKKVEEEQPKEEVK